MYIIELFFKLKERLKAARKPQNIDISADEDEAEEKCEHIFSPVDSTNTVLACVKCGYLIHCGSDEFKKKNIFENSDKQNDKNNNGDDFIQQ